MWGDFNLIEFQPRSWQGSLTNSMHPWLFHTTIWHYWLWFTFIFSMNLFFIYVYKTITYQRADIRGTRATGEKRRLAWPEMLIVIIPFFWAINIVTNALAYLRILEGSCGNVILNVQVSGFQWGWKYCYDDLFYTKYHNSLSSVGYGKSVVLGNPFTYINRTDEYTYKNRTIYELKEFTYIGLNNQVYTKERYYINPEATWDHRWNWNIDDKDDSELTVENYFCRNWLKLFGSIENEKNLKTLNKKWQHGYWVISQGLDYNDELYSEYLFKGKLRNNLIENDPRRLLRSSGALVLPTRNTIRLMACSEDVTHSWAVPALGFKMDCVPGRLFCLYLNITREGIYYGQCSELCGWNHFNMPIVLYALPIEHFIIWWEIELHSVFCKKNTLNSNDSNDYITYKLLNYKYK